MKVTTRANIIAAQLRRDFPDIVARVSLDTMEGEDAYIWISAPRAKIGVIRDAASDLTVEPLIEEGIFIVPRVAPRDGVRAE